MSFIAAGSVETEDDIPNHVFWGNLSLTDFRTAMRVDNVVTPDRARHALVMALLETNRRLSAYVLAQNALGYEVIGNVPALPGQPAGAQLALYQRAVWCLAKAQLVERYRDYDTTGNGDTRADELVAVADDYRRDAAWAINDLLGAPRTTVELI